MGDPQPRNDKKGKSSSNAKNTSPFTNKHVRLTMSMHERTSPVLATATATTPLSGKAKNNKKKR
tara:strand:+ start:594 stop:785 length:192 start_codon:yes stop_codon:yes gene_type:complete